jgi:hypothetical protein
MDNGGVQRPRMCVAGNVYMIHWHLGVKYSDPAVIDVSDRMTHWYKETVEEEKRELNEIRISLGYLDYVWVAEECNSLECLVDALAY